MFDDSSKIIFYFLSFFSLPHSDQIKLITMNFTRSYHCIDLAFCSTPKVLPISVLKLQMSGKKSKENETNQPQIQLHQVKPAQRFYNNADHEVKTMSTVEALIKLSMDQTTYLLLYLIHVLQANEMMDLSDLKEVQRQQRLAKTLLYNYLCSKSGHVPAVQQMEDFQRAIYLLNEVEPLYSVKEHFNVYFSQNVS